MCSSTKHSNATRPCWVSTGFPLCHSNLEGQDFLWGASLLVLAAPVCCPVMQNCVSFPAFAYFHIYLKYLQTIDNLAKIIGKTVNIRFALWISFLQYCLPFGIPTCPEQHLLSFPAEQGPLCWCMVLPSGVVLHFVLRAGTTAVLCNVLICNSLTYAGYNDTSGFGKTALLIYMRDNTPDDCYEGDLRHLI